MVAPFVHSSTLDLATLVTALPGVGSGAWNTKLPGINRHFVTAARDGVFLLTRRAQPITVIGEFVGASRQIKGVTSRWKQEQTSLAELSKQAIALHTWLPWTPPQESGSPQRSELCHCCMSGRYEDAGTGIGEDSRCQNYPVRGVGREIFTPLRQKVAQLRVAYRDFTRGSLEPNDVPISAGLLLGVKH